jgi:hypothetical protein
VSPYGCHDRPPLGAPRIVQDGWHNLPQHAVSTLPRTPRMVEVPHAMETGCQYTTSPAGPTDPRCAGCAWKA